MSADAILVLNAGSSSIKFAVFDLRAAQDPVLTVRGAVDGIGSAPRFRAHDVAGRTLTPSAALAQPRPPLDHAAATRHLIAWLADGLKDRRLIAAGHRVVHGGMRRADPAQINADLLRELDDLVGLDPLHEPYNLVVIRALSDAFPGLNQIACFDTAFHRTQHEVAQRFALPRSLTEQGIRRYGFHGLSYEYIASELPRHLGAKANGRVVVAHLGNGASLCGLLNRKSVLTTMGFSVLDGLMMGTRCGAIDPGVLLYLLRARTMSVAEIEHLLYHESGLLGVSGISSDMRDLLESADPRAREAIELYVYRVTRELGSVVAALQGLDALIFTAGIGENAARVRAMICEGCQWLGLELDERANSIHASKISSAGSGVDVLVIPTNEEVVIARAVVKALALAPAKD